jgi:hypothetical protein
MEFIVGPLHDIPNVQRRVVPFAFQWNARKVAISYELLRRAPNLHVTAGQAHVGKITGGGQALRITGVQRLKERVEYLHHGLFILSGHL